MALYSAEQPIKDAVITVPAFFNQAERRAVLQAARMAGLKVLQLINDNTATALSYGVFRRKDINTTAQVSQQEPLSRLVSRLEWALVPWRWPPFRMG